MPTDYNFVQLEALAAYFMNDFSEAALLDLETDEVYPIDLPEGTDTQTGPDPIIIMTPGGEYAMGGYTVAWLDQPGYPGTRYTYNR